MRIETYLNTTREDVEQRAHNIWLGISLGNKYFTAGHMERYIAWALTHTKERVLIVIGDAIQAVNIEVLDGRTPHHALKRARKLGDERHAMISAVIATLPPEQQTQVRLVRFDEVTEAAAYQRNLQVVEEAYARHPAFREEIRSIVRNGRRDRSEKIDHLPDERLDRLADYILDELPLYTNGVQVNGEAAVHTLTLYPAMTMLEGLCAGLQQGTRFPEVAAQLDLSNRTGILEAYVE